MRTSSGILMSSAAAASLIALAPARAAAPVTIEKSLLGIRILQTYRDVLSKLGQPRLVVRNGEYVLMESALDPSGNDLGGVRSVGYEGGGSSGGGSSPSMGGPGSGGPGMPGGGKMGKSMGGPGSGGPGMPGGMGGMGGGSASADADTSFGQAGGYGWVYHNASRQTAYVFLFNLEGRVLDILERGREGGMPTQLGLKLGDDVKKLYELYGWPDTIEDNEPGFILDYGTKYHAKFAVIKNKVVGIAVVLEESQVIHFFPEKSGGGGGAPGMGGGRRGGAGLGRRDGGGKGSVGAGME